MEVFGLGELLPIGAIQELEDKPISEATLMVLAEIIDPDEVEFRDKKLQSNLHFCQLEAIYTSVGGPFLNSYLVKREYITCTEQERTLLCV